jgi:hypothetical protein
MSASGGVVLQPVDILLVVLIAMFTCATVVFAGLTIFCGGSAGADGTGTGGADTVTAAVRPARKRRRQPPRTARASPRRSLTTERLRSRTTEAAGVSAAAHAQRERAAHAADPASAEAPEAALQPVQAPMQPTQEDANTVVVDVVTAAMGEEEEEEEEYAVRAEPVLRTLPPPSARVPVADLAPMHSGRHVGMVAAASRALGGSRPSSGAHELASAPQLRKLPSLNGRVRPGGADGLSAPAW